jgi:hypothetical protein
MFDCSKFKVQSLIVQSCEAALAVASKASPFKVGGWEAEPSLTYSAKSQQVVQCCQPSKYRTRPILAKANKLNELANHQISTLAN